MVWCGVVWCGWCGVVWCGVMWCGVVWCDVVWCGVVGCGVVWCGGVWCIIMAVDKSLSFPSHSLNPFHQPLIHPTSPPPPPPLSEFLLTKTGNMELLLIGQQYDLHQLMSKCVEQVREGGVREGMGSLREREGLERRRRRFSEREGGLGREKEVWEERRRRFREREGGLGREEKEV